MLLPFIAVGLLLIIYPFVQLVIAAFGSGGISNLSAFFDESANLYVLRTTFVDSAIVTVIAVACGAVLAWSLRVNQSRWNAFFVLAAVFVPFWMGSVIKLYSFTVILERLGLVNRVLMDLHLIQSPLSLLYNQPAVIVGMAYQMLPYAALPLYVGFLSIDLDLIRAAESLGAARVRALWTIAAPLALPSALATTTIVYIVSTGFYLTPILLGGATAPFSASLISQDIFDFYNVPGSAVSSIALLVGALVILLVGYKIVGRERLRKAMTS